MLFKLHFLFGCCVVTRGFCVGCTVRVTLLPVGVPRLLAPPCVTPGNGVESTAAAWRTALQASGTWAPMQKSHLLYHSAFCWKILARTTQLHSIPGRDVTRNQYLHSIIMKMELQRGQMAQLGTQHLGPNLTPILLDGGSSGAASTCFLSQNRKPDWVSQEDLWIYLWTVVVFLKSLAASECFVN